MVPSCVVYTNHHRIGQPEFIESQTEWAGKWNKENINYHVTYHQSLKLITDRQLRTAVNIAMTTWDIEIPPTFKPVHSPSNADIKITFEHPDQNNYFKDKPSVLAYAFFPEQGTYSGTVVFNAAYIWDLKGKGIKAKEAIRLGLIENAGNPDNILKTYNVYHVLIHELGHSIGLRHDVTGLNDGRDVMDPFYKGDVLDLSDRDINRIRIKYGQREFKNITHYRRLKRWLIRAIRR
jgi:hypothetical protein